MRYTKGASHAVLSKDPNVPQSVAHLICVPQVPQMWHKMWHNSIYILSTNFTNGDVNRHLYHGDAGEETANKTMFSLVHICSKHGEINAELHSHWSIQLRI